MATGRDYDRNGRLFSHIDLVIGIGAMPSIRNSDQGLLVRTDGVVVWWHRQTLATTRCVPPTQTDTDCLEYPSRLPHHFISRAET
uniref:Uncharacterized protein n=1 Tax=Oryza meridionalis TaxID=40149 RepID=A0A0E0D0E0_9ORYZ